MDLKQVLVLHDRTKRPSVHDLGRLHVPQMIGKDQPSVKELNIKEPLQYSHRFANAQFSEMYYRRENEVRSLVSSMLNLSGASEEKMKEKQDAFKLFKVTLPKGTVINGQDASYYSFICSNEQIEDRGMTHPFYTYQKQITVELPYRKENGDVWEIKLERDSGRKNPDGKWIPDRKEIICTYNELEQGLDNQAFEYHHYRLEKANEKVNKAEKRGAALAEESKDAQKASQALADGRRGDFPQER